MIWNSNDLKIFEIRNAGGFRYVDSDSGGHGYIGRCSPVCKTHRTRSAAQIITKPQLCLAMFMLFIKHILS